jgi:hypothetical protein
MTKLTIYLVAQYYLRKMKKTGGIWRIQYSETTGSLYIQRRKHHGGYVDKIRISDHLPRNSRGNIKTSQTNNKLYITVYSLFNIQKGL